MLGRTLGIIGYGSIGRKVAQIAEAFGMKVICFTRTVRESDSVEFVSFDELLAESDVVSVHCPLNDGSKLMFGRDAFGRMKDSAFFINTARGGIVDENALREALDGGIIAGAAVDVLTEEPMNGSCVLYGAKNLIMTPHVAWAPVETRRRLINIVTGNIRAWLDDSPVNVVS